MGARDGSCQVDQVFLMKIRDTFVKSREGKKSQ